MIESRGRFSFSLRTVFVAVTCVGLALGAFQFGLLIADSYLSRLLGIVASLGFLGAAIGSLFGRIWWGAAIGLLIGTLLLGATIVIIAPGEHP